MKFLKIFIIFAFLAFVASCVYYGNRRIDSDRLWNLVQDWRVSQGLNLYRKNDLLCQIAQMRVSEVKNDWSHSQFQEAIDKFLSKYPKKGVIVGENLAAWQYDDKETLDAWLRSPSHKKNLMSDFSDSCIVAKDSYVVQIFANL